MESEKKTLKTDSNFAPSFADHHLNGHCLIKNIDLKTVEDQSGRDKNSHILKHQIEKEHPCPQYEDFKVISSGFRNNTKKRKLSEVLWINTLRPSLKKQEKSIPLKLFSFIFPLYCLFTCSNLAF